MDNETSRSRKNHYKQNRFRKHVLPLFLIGFPVMLIVIGSTFYLKYYWNEKPIESVNRALHPSEEKKEKSITISTAGDFTIGTDEAFAYSGSFVEEVDKNDYHYFIQGIKDIFLEDDLTTVNLETTLTTSTQKAQKKFRFKGDPSYAQILQLGGIDAVNLANNHIHDYLEKGYEDTLTSLKNHQIGFFGYDHKYITTVKDIKVGALGYEGWNDTPDIRRQVENDIQSLKDQGVQIILVHYHWGVERQYVPTESQKSLARFTIDAGADLILGHHPHVIQGIEEYNGKFIVYSLGNFMFGGNRNPSDKDTFVFQQTFHFVDKELTDKKVIRVIPFSISSVSDRNNYQPIPLTGAEGDRVMEKIITSSQQISDANWTVYNHN